MIYYFLYFYLLVIILQPHQKKELEIPSIIVNFGGKAWRK